MSRISWKAKPEWVYRHMHVLVHVSTFPHPRKTSCMKPWSSITMETISMLKWSELSQVTLPAISSTSSLCPLSSLWNLASSLLSSSSLCSGGSCEGWCWGGGGGGGGSSCWGGNSGLGCPTGGWGCCQGGGTLAFCTQGGGGGGAVLKAAPIWYGNN